MTKISAIILTGNREENIESCLKTVSWIKEKIIVDTGIKNKTLKTAQKYNCKIIKASKEQNFSQWRNQGAKAATGEWLLYLDTDERLTASLRDEIKDKISKSKNTKMIAGYYLPRKNYFLGKEFKTAYPDYQLRLIKKKALVSWQGKIHETPKVQGKTAYLKNPLFHLAFNHQSLEKAVLNTLNWSKLEADLKFKVGHPQMTSLRFIRVLLFGFWQQFVKKQIWRDGVEGVIEGIYQVFSLFFTYVRLWEKQRKETLKESYQKIDEKL